MSNRSTEDSLTGEGCSPVKRDHSSDADEPEAQSESQNSTASIDQELSCGICLDILVSPYTIIPCLHSFDKSCLMEWWKKNSNCPTCQKESTSAKSAFQLKAIIDRVHKNKRQKLQSTTGGNNNSEIFPSGDGGADLFDEEIMEDDVEPEDGLIWPCLSCDPNNATGYVCPVPIPAPTPAERQEANHAVPPSRETPKTPLDSPAANGKPGVDFHTVCVACSNYIPLNFTRPIKCSNCSNARCNNFDPAGCPSGMPFYRRLDVKLPMHSVDGLLIYMPPNVNLNRHERTRFVNYMTAKNLSVDDVLHALFDAKHDQVAEDLNDQIADEEWGPGAYFCNYCVGSVAMSMFFTWWMHERQKSLDNDDGIIPSKQDCMEESAEHRRTMTLTETD
ncbi:hypothetical protein BU17DRAFT_84170 [Hysterangium stoloniferum]|nr:hypothetical protein BU17DRAFT_84170 [Hysterangium stoloniferum]